MQIDFLADKTYQKVGEANAADAVDLARDTFMKNLDFSDDSIVLVEEILALLYQDAQHTDPSPEKVFQMAKVFGSYVGEVFRRRYGAEWGMVTLSGEQLPGLRALQSGKIFWPWGKASNRIENGPEDNMVYYYHVLRQSMNPMEGPAAVAVPTGPTGVVTEDEPSEQKPAVDPPSWLRRLFGA